MHVHLTLSVALWSALSLAFCAFSLYARRVFWGGVRRAALLPPGRTREYALHEAWDEVHDEEWRLSQHAVSFLIGLPSLWVSRATPSDVPTDAAVYASAVVVVLFYLNVASGINTLRALLDWHWKERFVGNRRGIRWLRGWRGRVSDRQGSIHK